MTIFVTHQTTNIMEWIPFPDSIEKHKFIKSLGFVRHGDNYIHPYFSGGEVEFNFEGDSAPSSVMNTLLNGAFNVGREVEKQEVKEMMANY